MELAHTMLRVSDPDACLEFYRDAFGFELVNEKEFDDFTLYFLKLPGQDVELELTYNHGKDERYEKGEGYGHIAIRVPEGSTVKEVYRRAVAAGGEDYRPPESIDRNYAFVKDPEGYEIEILGRDI